MYTTRRGLKRESGNHERRAIPKMVTVSLYTVGVAHLMGNIYYSEVQGRGFKRENGNRIKEG
ncbi:MAG: hypothetical protein JRF49_09345 [Deltaproteobacteria bacterium]|nr:hypothetical protein [Deltaproteobacteria bacterium]